MSNDGKCHICGTCWWVGCENPADYTIDVALRRNGLPLYDGDVDLCAGHYRHAQATRGRLDLSWDAIEQALAFRPQAKAKA